MYQKGKIMDKEEKKQTGVSLFGQSEYLVGSDPIEEMFALNLGDFIFDFRRFSKKNQLKIK